MSLLTASADAEARILKRTGAVLIIFVVIAVVTGMVLHPFDRRARDVISLAIETPYVGQGVAVGTPVIMHGVKIGQVVSVTSRPGGGVRLSTDLQEGPTRGLTDAMGIDYRPANYFGVTGINVIPAQSGRPLRNGMQISIVPHGNFSLQSLLYRLGELSNGVFNPRLVSVIERATRYVDGLNPLLETLLVVGNSLAKVQTVNTERLLRNAAGVSVAFPGFADALIYTGNNFLHNSFQEFDYEKFKRSWHYYSTLSDQERKVLDDNVRLMRDSRNTDEYFTQHFIPVLDTARTDLFSRIGYLESSHINDLFPTLESIRTMADAVPQIFSPEKFAYTLTELRQRFERMYEGAGGQRALQVRIILDRFPGIAAPLGLVAGGSS